MPLKEGLLEGLRRIPLASQVILELYFWESLTGAELGQVRGHRTRLAHGVGVQVLGLDHELLQGSFIDGHGGSPSRRGWLAPGPLPAPRRAMPGKIACWRPVAAAGPIRLPARHRTPR